MRGERAFGPDRLVWSAGAGAGGDPALQGVLVARVRRDVLLGSGRYRQPVLMLAGGEYVCRRIRREGAAYVHELVAAPPAAQRLGRPTLDVTPEWLAALDAAARREAWAARLAWLELPLSCVTGLLPRAAQHAIQAAVGIEPARATRRSLALSGAMFVAGVGHTALVRAGQRPSLLLRAFLWLPPDWLWLVFAAMSLGLALLAIDLLVRSGLALGDDGYVGGVWEWSVSPAARETAVAKLPEPARAHPPGTVAHAGAEPSGSPSVAEQARAQPDEQGVGLAGAEVVGVGRAQRGGDVGEPGIGRVASPRP